MFDWNLGITRISSEAPEWHKKKKKIKLSSEALLPQINALQLSLRSNWYERTLKAPKSWESRAELIEEAEPFWG